MPDIVPGKISISKSKRHITFYRVTVNVVMEHDENWVAVCWTPSNVSDRLCYLSLPDHMGEGQRTIPTELVERSTPLVCNLVLSVVEDDVHKVNLTASLQHATPVLPAMNVPWLDVENTVSLSPPQSCTITKIILALSLHQLEDIYSSLQEASFQINRKFMRLLQVHSHLLTYVKDTVLGDLNPMSIQYLLESCANKMVLKSKAINQVIFKTNNTIVVRERCCDELVEVRLSECGIPNGKTLVTWSKVETSVKMANHEGMKDSVNPSLDDEEEGAEKRT